MGGSPSTRAAATLSPAGPPASVEADPELALIGRPVAALAEDGQDAVLRIGEPGWTLPDGEILLDIHGDRVLSAITDRSAAEARLLVRDLGGAVLRTIDAGFNVPQAAIVRGDEVFYAGVQADPYSDELEFEDRGVWLARDGEAPRQVMQPMGAIRYQELNLSPDGRTLGIWVCGIGCRSILLDRSGRDVQVEAPGLDVLTNDAAILLASWSGIAGYGVDDGAELWQHELDGTNWGRHALADGRRLLHAVLQSEGGADRLVLELIDGTSGTVELSVEIPAEGPSWYVSPTLSTDRFAVLVPGVLPDAGDAPLEIMVLDLSDGRLVETDLRLEPIPEG